MIYADEKVIREGLQFGLNGESQAGGWIGIQTPPWRREIAALLDQLDYVDRDPDLSLLRKRAEVIWNSYPNFKRAQTPENNPEHPLFEFYNTVNAVCGK